MQANLLKYREAPGFQLFEKTPQGEQESTQQRTFEAVARDWLKGLGVPVVKGASHGRHPEGHDPNP
jgi:hypothetical protein